jgi:hypothetical protein
MYNPQAIAQMQRELENRQDNSGTGIRVKVATGKQGVSKSKPTLQIVRKKAKSYSRDDC